MKVSDQLILLEISRSFIWAQLVLNLEFPF